MANIKTDGTYMGLPMNIKRSEPIPLDTSELYYAKSEAEAYAENGKVSYVGQTIKVIENGTVTGTYVINNEAGDLSKLVTSVDLDNAIATAITTALNTSV